MILKMIVAVDRNWGIGKANGLLFRLKKDMEFFRARTTGAVVVMGGNTLRSLPGGQPLKGRDNIVLTAGEAAGCLTVKTIAQLFATLKQYDNRDIFVIGGASLYRQLAPYCSEALVTKVDADGGADAFIDNLDENPGWRLEGRSDLIEDGEFNITFNTYKNYALKRFGEE